MIFTSIAFLIFYTAFFLLYWFVFNKNLRLQNLLVLFGSYVFYIWWDWRFLSILAGTSVLNFILGIYIEKTTIPKYRKILLWLGLLQGIGVLVLFKYYNFFITSFNQAVGSLDININLQPLNILIPLGISYFTFRTISYLLDVDKGKIKATTDWIVFLHMFHFFQVYYQGQLIKQKHLFRNCKKRGYLIIIRLPMDCAKFCGAF